MSVRHTEAAPVPSWPPCTVTRPSAPGRGWGGARLLKSLLTRTLYVKLNNTPGALGPRSNPRSPWELCRDPGTGAFVDPLVPPSGGTPAGPRPRRAVFVDRLRWHPPFLPAAPGRARAFPGGSAWGFSCTCPLGLEAASGGRAVTGPRLWGEGQGQAAGFIQLVCERIVLSH